MNIPAIGPTLISTIFSSNATASVSNWCEYLEQQIHSTSLITDDVAQHWGWPDLAGRTMTWLENSLGEPWLRIIESPNSEQTIAFRRYGWLSLEISVQDVDALYQSLQGSPLTIIGKPANLDVSDDIRAMQVLGPDGEVLYLTEIKAPVPPFELQFARCAVDRLFIPVAMVPNREEALAVYEKFAHTNGLQFDTKITVINKALGKAIDTRHPVAAVQLAGSNLVELDQIDGLESATNNSQAPRSGIGMISFQVEALPDDQERYLIRQGPYANCQACMIHGGGGALMELIKP